MSQQTQAKKKKPVTTYMTIELYARRKKLLELDLAGGMSGRAIQEIAMQEITARNAQASPQAINRMVNNIRMDWKRRDRWKNLIWRVEQESKDLPGEILSVLRIARERALTLIRTASNDSARVGAIDKLLKTVAQEIEFLQIIGRLPKVERQPLVKVNVNSPETTNTVNLLKQYELVIHKSAERNLQENNPGESVHTSQTDAEAG